MYWQFCTHIHTTLDKIQLVLLCREVNFNYFGPDFVFNRLITNLKYIEQHGIMIRSNQIKDSVLCIFGDNLGSHVIGGFVANFSTANYSCRYCAAPKDVLYNISISSDLRTPQNYSLALNQLSESDDINNFHGIKFNSCFNQLNYLHVCQPGLPPCLAHDLFEGVVQYDLALAIKYFVKQKLFTFVQLNKLMQQFKYLGSDSNDRPIKVNDNGN